MIEKKKLAFLLPDMTGGGAERVALRLIEDFHGKGHPIDLVLAFAIGELLPLLPPGVRVIDLGAKRLRDVLRPLIRYLRTEKPHAVQISMWPLTVLGLVARRLARSRARIVVSDHSILSKHVPPSAHFALKHSVRLVYPWADARVMVARQAADDLASLSGLDRASIEVIYNPVGTPPPETGPNAEIEALWGAAEGRVLTVGKLKEEKNHPLLVRSFARAFGGTKKRLMIVGEGPFRPELEAVIAAEGVSDQVLLPGFTTNTWPYYASADLFALSSNYEGYPLVLIEAMRSGLSIVSTNCESGPQEILDGGRYGSLVPVGDETAFAAALEQGLRTPHDRNALRARAEELSGQSTSDRYLELMLGK